jgi:hypothetical protein
MLRPLLLVTAVSCLSPVPRVIAAPAAAIQQACQVNATGESMEVRCPLAPADQPTRYAFSAHFSGGHDDTHAWLSARMNDAPLVCSEGSKPELEGEEGEVSLVCLFTVPAGSGPAHQLTVQVQWRHAQYTRFEIESL